MKQPLKTMLFVMGLLLPLGVSFAEEPAPAARLDAMANVLASATGFSVNVRCEYDVVQPDGVKVTFGESRHVRLQRPSYFASDNVRSDGQRSELRFDGTAMTFVMPEQKVYSRVAFAGSVDEMVTHLVRDLRHGIPLARLMLVSLPEELKTLVKSTDYIERTTLANEPADHIVASLEQADLQAWITLGEQPRLLRVIITYRNEPGQPQFRADFADWQLSPTMKPAELSWSVPEGYEEVSFVSPVSKGVVGHIGSEQEFKR